MASRKKFYAWRVGDQEGIVTSWPECEAIVRGKNARYKGFYTLEEAEAWLRSGARYGPWDDGVTSPWLELKKSPRRLNRERTAQAEVAEKTPTIRGKLPQDAIYFDSGTGHGEGTEVNVTTWDGKPLAYLVAPEGRLTRRSTVLLSPGRSNNYGELIACLLAIRLARKLGYKMVCGDSRVALDHWSRGKLKPALAQADPDLAKLASITARERAAFEAEGGLFRHVPGSRNPADLGFHVRRRKKRH